MLTKLKDDKLMKGGDGDAVTMAVDSVDTVDPPLEKDSNT